MRTVIIDASLHMSGRPLEACVEHALAFETPNTPAILAYGRDDVEHMSLRNLRDRGVQDDRMGDGSGFGHAVAAAVFARTVEPIVYVDARAAEAVAEAMGSRDAEVRVFGDVDHATLTALSKQQVLPVPHASTGAGLDVPGIIRSLAHRIEGADRTLIDFREQLDRDPVRAFEQADGALDAAAARQECQWATETLRTIGNPARDRARGDGRIRSAAILELVRERLDGAMAQASSTSTSQTTNLVRQAVLRAAWKVDETFRGSTI